MHKLGAHFSMEDTKTFQGAGCRKCNSTGYKGRLALYEVLVPNDQMKHMIASGASIIDLNKVAIDMGSTTVIMDARKKVNEGLTTVEEVLRVLGPQVL